MEIRYAALIGLGAMGSFFAPRMEAKLGRDHFQVVASGARKERLETKGVTINGVNYKFSVRTPEEEGPKADLIIMAMKDMGLLQAIEDIRNLVGEHTQILCVMNGIESEEKVAAAYGWDHVLYSYMRMSIVMKDGVADFDPNWGTVHFGEAKNETLTARTQMVRDFFESCGIPYVIDGYEAGDLVQVHVQRGRKYDLRSSGNPFRSLPHQRFCQRAAPGSYAGGHGYCQSAGG